VAERIADLVQPNLGAERDRTDADGRTNQYVDRQGADGEANGDLDESTYDCTTS
jgi:hypothetical protein